MYFVTIATLKSEMTSFLNGLSMLLPYGYSTNFQEVLIFVDLVDVLQTLTSSGTLVPQKLIDVL